MKKFWIIAIVCTAVVGIVSCNKVRRSPGRVYMPDMAYSRAYETYAGRDTAVFTNMANDWGSEGHHKIYYSALPVTGTMARGDMLWSYTIPNDSLGYVQSASVASPINADSIDIKEAERLYLVNCGICHGSKLDGQGPLYNDGKGPFPNAPKNLVGDEIKKMADGTIFHSITFGKGSMGSYASQLNTMQRWMVIAYIRKKQGGGGSAVVTDTTMAKKPVVADTAAKMGK